MWKPFIFDTRDHGEMSRFMDGFVHVIPRRALGDHWVQINCWCDPRVTWPRDGETCVVWHRHVRAPKYGEYY